MFLRTDGQSSQLQAMRQRDEAYMAGHGEDMSEKRKNPRPRADFIRSAGIGPELAEFVTEFIGKPENFISMLFEKRREIKMQMDAILSAFEQ